MFQDLLEYDNVIRSSVRFKDVQELEDKLEADVVKPAELKAAERQQQLLELFG